MDTALRQATAESEKQANGDERQTTMERRTRGARWARRPLEEKVDDKYSIYQQEYLHRSTEGGQEGERKGTPTKQGRHVITSEYATYSMPYNKAISMVARAVARWSGSIDTILV